MLRFDHGQALHKSGRQAASPNEEWTKILQLFEPFLDLCVKDKKFLPDLEAKCQKYLKICGYAAQGFVFKPIVFCFDLSMMQIAGGM